MNLIIDVGNTSVKLAVFKLEKLIFKKIVTLENIRNGIDEIKKEFKDIEKAIIASVGNLKSSDVGYIKNQFRILKLDSSTNVPFQNQYKSTETLGVDRIALVSASVKNYREQ